MNQYSQNDPQWKGLKHGTSGSTIGATGCTITALSMMLHSIGYEENPKTVNEKLTNNGGYASGNLIVWSAIQKIWPRAKFSWRGYSYTDDDNAKVADAIKKYGSCLVAVNGAPIGGNTRDGHWVLYIGNQRLIDPWDGLEKPTSSYSATGYSIIELMKDDDEEIPVNKKTYEMLVGKATKYDKFVELGFDNPDAVKQKLADNEKTIANLNQTISNKNGSIATQQEEISNLTEQLTSAQSRVNSLTEQAKKIPTLEKENEYLTEQRAKWIEAEKTFNRQVAQLKTENEKLRSRALDSLLKAVVENIGGYIKDKLGGKKTVASKKQEKGETNNEKVSD